MCLDGPVLIALILLAFAGGMALTWLVYWVASRR